MPPKQTETALATRKDLEKAIPLGSKRDFLKLIAMDIGKSVARHIEIMYPDAVSAASSTFLLSVRNYTHNEIMALVDVKGDMAEMLDRIIERHAHRRRIKAAYRSIRKEPAGHWPGLLKAAWQMEELLDRNQISRAEWKAAIAQATRGNNDNL